MSVHSSTNNYTVRPTPSPAGGPLPEAPSGPYFTQPVASIPCVVGFTLSPTLSALLDGYRALPSRAADLRELRCFLEAAMSLGGRLDTAIVDNTTGSEESRACFLAAVAAVREMSSAAKALLPTVEKLVAENVLAAQSGRRDE